MATNDILMLTGIICAVVLVVLYFWQQRSKSIQWLIWAVSAAEKELGSKTGQLKLRRVYDWYVEKFPWLSAIVPFVIFSKWVDKALTTMRRWVDNKTPIGEYITGSPQDAETVNTE